MVGVVEAEGVTVDMEVGIEVAEVMVAAVLGSRGNHTEVIELEAWNYSNNGWTQLTSEQMDKVNKLRKVFRDNKCKMAAANSDNRG
eukprot:14841003-Ditylum_brightwellii.AAC.1